MVTENLNEYVKIEGREGDSQADTVYASQKGWPATGWKSGARFENGSRNGNTARRNNEKGMEIQMSKTKCRKANGRIMGVTCYSYERPTSLSLLPSIVANFLLPLANFYLMKSITIIKSTLPLIYYLS